MKKIAILIFLFFLFYLFVAGCAAPPVWYNMTPKELKTDKYFYKQWTGNITIKEMQKRLNIYNGDCGNQFNIEVDPVDSKKARFQHTHAGLSKGATIFIMEFDENDNGITTIKAWSNNSIMWKKTHADRMLEAIENPYKCIRSF